MKEPKMARSLCTIAREIHEDWKSISPYAKPYLDAMATLSNVNNMYGYDSGSSIVLYFLANAQGWRGERARTIKAELKALL
jgi:hypothetical protein